MNKIIENIMTRTSTKQYNEKRICKEDLEIIIKAGISAPSALNQQNWKVIGLYDESLVEELRSITFKALNDGRDHFYDAHTLVLVFVEKGGKFSPQNGSLVMENMMLAAHGMDIGSCWINCVKDVFQTEEGKKFKEKICPDDNYEVLATLVLGYSDKVFPAKPRKEDSYKIL